jgi:HSP20 family protein
MTLVRWSPTRITPLRDLTNIQDEMQRLFDGLFTRGTLQGDLSAIFTPAVDIEETPEEFVVRVDLPGVAQQDVKVSLMGDTLTIRGERRQESPAKVGNQHRLERVHGTFERSFTLGTPVRSENVKAQYRDGVLEVRVPKAEEARMRQIEVQVG